LGLAVLNHSRSLTGNGLTFTLGERERGSGLRNDRQGGRQNLAAAVVDTVAAVGTGVGTAVEVVARSATGHEPRLDTLLCVVECWEHCTAALATAARKAAVRQGWNRTVVAAGTAAAAELALVAVKMPESCHSAVGLDESVLARNSSAGLVEASVLYATATVLLWSVQSTATRCCLERCSWAASTGRPRG